MCPQLSLPRAQAGAPGVNRPNGKRNFGGTALAGEPKFRLRSRRARQRAGDGRRLGIKRLRGRAAASPKGSHEHGSDCAAQRMRASRPGNRSWSACRQKGMTCRAGATPKDSANRSRLNGTRCRASEGRRGSYRRTADRRAGVGVIRLRRAIGKMRQSLSSLRACGRDESLIVGRRRCQGKEGSRRGVARRAVLRAVGGSVSAACGTVGRAVRWLGGLRKVCAREMSDGDGARIDLPVRWVGHARSMDAAVCCAPQSAKRGRNHKIRTYMLLAIRRTGMHDSGVRGQAEAL